MQKVFILGIGNPEEKYNNTRHNIGKNWVEKIAKDHALSFVKKSKLKCSICEIKPNVYLVVPDVYVNETGKVASSNNWLNTMAALAISNDDSTGIMSALPLVKARNLLRHNKVTKKSQRIL